VNEVKGTLSRSARRTAGLIALALSLVLFAAPTAWGAPTPFVDIHSAGPLSDIYIGNDLSCQVRSGGFSSTEFFPNAAGPGDCGTFLAVNGQLYGPDFAHHTTTATAFAGDASYSPFTPVSQTGVSGSGTPSSPYRVVTTVNAGASGLSVSEADSYVIGTNYYQADITVTNNSGSTQTALVYHAADCLLHGSDSGFGFVDMSSPSAPAPACALNPNNSPTSGFEELVPITTGNDYVENQSGTNTDLNDIWGDITNMASLPDSCDCATNENNAEGINWTFLRRPTGTSSTFTLRTQIIDTTASGGFSFSGPANSTVGGTVATITDPNTSATPAAYSATINWGDGTTSPGTIAGGNGTFNVTGSHAYTAGGTYPVAVTITSVGTNQGSSTVNDTAAITAAPSPVVTGAPSIGITRAGFTGSVNPDGLPTTASFQYGLDPRYTGGGRIVYTKSTPPQSVGSDFTTHTVSASVTGLVPNAVYHVRLVATNSAGTSFGPDIAFKTRSAPPPSAPTLGKTFNITPVSGFVLIKLHGVFVPLTELSQIPANTLINALHGTLKLTTAGGSSGPAHDAAAKGKKRKKVKTQSGNFGGAVFKISQSHNGLATLSLVDGAVKGAPGYGTCKAHKAGDVTATAARSRTLQLLRASAHGKFRTRGRYSAATVRGTTWTVADRCDGTLTRDITDSVAVTDFVRHKTIVLHAGQSYLAPSRRRHP